MLHEFVTENREELIRRCRAKMEMRSVPPPTPAELQYGVPCFLDQLVDALPHHLSPNSEIGRSAARHGHDLKLQGFTVSQVVPDYGNVCQSITDLALQLNAPINVEDFRTLNRCLDDAIAGAVTEYGRGNQPAVDTEGAREDGRAALGDLITRSLAEVRLQHDVRERTQFGVAEFIAELAPAAALDASARGLSLNVDAGNAGVNVDADRSILAATVVNLLQNAFKFTRLGTTVTLRGSATPDRVRIEVEDEWGGFRTATSTSCSSRLSNGVQTERGWVSVSRSAAGRGSQNQVELWFAKIERDLLARGIFTSLPDLDRKIRRYITRYNEDPKPIRWIYSNPAHLITTDSADTVR